MVFAISADPGTSQISLDDFHFVLSSAKSLQVVDRGRVLHWALHVFGAKVGQRRIFLVLQPFGCFFAMRA